MYENARATKLLATHCLMCNRPLVDATSVETGLGPECRKKHGFLEAQTAPQWELVAQFCPPEYMFREGETAREVVNRLVYHAALGMDKDKLCRVISAIRWLGYTKMADRLMSRLGDVKVEVVGGTIEVSAPYSDRFLYETKWMGRRWDPKRKVTIFPEGVRHRVWEAIRASYAGKMLVSHKGMTRI